MRYAQRHIERQTGFMLEPPQINTLWNAIGRRAIFDEIGVVHIEVCIAMVDVLCNSLVGQDWPLNGDVGDDDLFFHHFVAAGVAAGYQVSPREAA